MSDLSPRLVDELNDVAARCSVRRRQSVVFFNTLSVDDLVSNCWLHMLINIDKLAQDGVMVKGMALTICSRAISKHLRDERFGEQRNYTEMSRVVKASEEAAMLGKSSQWAANKINMKLEHFEEALWYVKKPRVISLDEIPLEHILDSVVNEKFVLSQLLWSRINSALATLTTRELNCIYSYYYLDKMPTETGYMMGTSRSNISESLSRANAKLKELF